MTPAPYLSVIAPVYNGEGFIERSVLAIVEALEEYGQPFELLVVCDGSSDQTSQIAERVVDPRVRTLRYEINRGKGFALCYGVAHARGRLVGWIDADLDIDPMAIVEAARVFDEWPVDAVVGSKRHPQSEVDYPLARRVYSSGYQLIVRTLFRVNVRDTQVGAKLFRREMLDTVLPLLLIKRYAFDVEVLAVGAEFGFDRVVEIPIRLDYRFSGTGVNWEAVWRMFVDTLAIGYRIHLRHWYVRQFAVLQRERMELLAAAAERDEDVELPAVPLSNLHEIREARS
jgi:glycosyltransferase involved in cell wall biosynthesis